MGYEIDKVERIRIINKETGEEIYSKEFGDRDSSVPCTIDGPTISVEKNEGLTIKGSQNAQFIAIGIIAPPNPNISMIISPGDQHGNAKTELRFYRPKYYNWFQRLMYKMCFGITIKQGDEVRREYL